MTSETREPSVGEPVNGNIGNRKPRWVQRLDRTLDLLLGTAVASTSIVQPAESSAAFSLVEDQVGDFAGNSKVLMAVLNEVRKAHPCVSAVISIFMGALTLELARRHNDKKVLALITKMCDMMSVIASLKDLVLDAEGKKTVEGRLRQRVGAVIESIKRCAGLCESYQKRHIAVRFFTSLQWKDKFADLAAQFDLHKADLQFDLQMYIGIAVTNLKTTLAAARQDALAMMTLVFEKMRSPEERELAALVASAGGTDKVLANDALLGDVLGKFKLRSAGMAQQEQDSDDADLTPSSLRTEIAKNPDEIVNEDAKAFDQKFGAVLTQLEVEQKVPLGSDRVAQGDPPDQIVDQPLPELSQPDSVAASSNLLQAGIGEANAAVEHQSSLGISQHWSRTLVSLPARFEPEPPTPSAMEDRLTRIETKLDERATEHAAFAVKLDLRMARLETLLARLVSAQTATS